MPRTRQAMKQRRPAATDDGMNDDAVLVDEPQFLERSRELGRSDEDTPLGLRFQRRDRLAKVTLHLDRVLPRKVAPRARHDGLRRRPELLCPLPLAPPRNSPRHPATTDFAFASSLCAPSRLARGAFSSGATAGQAPSIS